VSSDSTERPTSAQVSGLLNNGAQPAAADPGAAGAERLLVAELVARGMEGFVKNSMQTPRITEELRLPAFEHSAHQPYCVAAIALAAQV
jgi:hypothetical protein